MLEWQLWGHQTGADPGGRGGPAPSSLRFFLVPSFCFFTLPIKLTCQFGQLVLMYYSDLAQVLHLIRSLRSEKNRFSYLYSETINLCSVENFVAGIF